MLPTIDLADRVREAGFALLITTHEPVDAGDIASSLGLDRGTVDDALARLVDAGWIDQDSFASPSRRYTFGASYGTVKGGPSMTTSSDLKEDQQSLVGDYDAISNVVQLCLDGEAKGDVTKLQEAFHQDARMFGELAGTRYDVPIQELFDMAAQGPADTGNYQSRIVSITQVGDAATATVAEEGYWGTVSFIDFFSLCRISGTWKIVNKTFAHVGGEPPA